MIKASYSPITCIRYVIVDQLPESDDQRVIRLKIMSRINQTRRISAKQLRRANNTKSK